MSFPLCVTSSCILYRLGPMYDTIAKKCPICGGRLEEPLKEAPDAA